MKHTDKPFYIQLIIYNIQLEAAGGVWTTGSAVEQLLLSHVSPGTSRDTKQFLSSGCDSGFGHMLARRLSEMGLTVFAGVLDVNGAGAQQLRESGSENLQVLQLDVTDSSQIETAHHHISAQVADTGDIDKHTHGSRVWVRSYRDKEEWNFKGAVHTNSALRLNHENKGFTLFSSR